MPSVDLPRISATEAAALATPNFNAPANDIHRPRDEDGESSNNRGLLFGLGLVLLLGLGFVAFKYLGGSNTATPGPGTDPKSVAGSRDSNEPPIKAVAPEVVPKTDPVPNPDSPPDPGAEAGAPSTPRVRRIRRRANRPRRSCKRSPPRPTPLVEPKPPKQPKVEQPKGDPVALLEDARKASLAGNATQAYELAKSLRGRPQRLRLAADGRVRLQDG